MTVDVWRVTHRRWVRTAYSGDGAFENGGRWNSEATRVVYTASSLSLAILECLVNLRDAEELVDYSVVPAAIPADQIEVVPPARLPARWSRTPPPAALRRLGDEWAKSRRSLALRVPSAVVPSEWNYVINPLHPAFQSAKIGEPTMLDIDDRILRLTKSPR